MKYGVIDVGSNSVRLMISDGTNTLSKHVKTTKLAENMCNGVLHAKSIERTVNAVCELNFLALSKGVKSLYVFATAAVRQASNKLDFISQVYECCKLKVEVLSGADEAKFGLDGALSGKDGGIIDVGGASTEIAVVKGNNTVYSKSLPIGAVKLKDACGQDLETASKVIEQTIEEYGNIVTSDFYSIGGTATSIASMMQELEPYDPKKTDGYKVGVNELKALTEKLYNMSVEDRKLLKGLQPERAEVISCGTLLLLKIMEKIGLKYIIVSEKDNLEGYLVNKLERK